MRPLHQTHAPNHNKRCQCHQRVDGDAVEHGRKTSFFEICDTGTQADGGQGGDHQEFAGALHNSGYGSGNEAYAVQNCQHQEKVTAPKDIPTYITEMA